MKLSCPLQCEYVSEHDGMDYVELFCQPYYHIPRGDPVLPPRYSARVISLFKQPLLWSLTGTSLLAWCQLNNKHKCGHWNCVAISHPDDLEHVFTAPSPILLLLIKLSSKQKQNHKNVHRDLMNPTLRNTVGQSQDSFEWGTKPFIFQLLYCPASFQVTFPQFTCF